MNLPVSRLKDPDMQAVPAALMRAQEKARVLAEQTGTPFIVRQSTEEVGGVRRPSPRLTGQGARLAADDVAPAIPLEDWGGLYKDGK